jgi:glycerol transport system ATP-binding protein
MLKITDLELLVGGVAHLAAINASFQPGTLTTILGRTGAGKTTLMRAIAGLIAPDRGQILLDGTGWTRLPPWKRPVAMVTQQFINYPHLNVRDNVAFPLVRAGVAKADAAARAEAALARVGLAAMVDRRPSALSGGQQQRVAIARALVKKAPVLLLDEPFVNLDYNLREAFRKDLVDLLAVETGTVVLYASTDPREALQMGDQIVLLADGRIVQSGSPRDVFANPASLTAARVVNDPPINPIPFHQNGVADFGALGQQAITLPSGAYTLGLRASDIRAGGPHQARVTLTEVTGSETLTHLSLNGLDLVMQEKSVVLRSPGNVVGVHLDLHKGLVFGADGQRAGV